MKIILAFSIDRSIPVGEARTFEDISKACGLNYMNTKRVIRHAIHHHRVFQESNPGTISHSALSAVLAGDDLIRNALVVQLGEFWPAAALVGQAIACIALLTTGRLQRP